MLDKKHSDLAVAVIALSFVLWATVFIYRSSFIAEDGRRYFSLFEDSMISMRYAWNFAHGSGLVWNPGQYVEGYTNLLMVLLMSLIIRVFGDKSLAVLAVQVLGIAFMLATAYTVTFISDHLTPPDLERYRPLARVLSFACALAYYPLAYWSLMGMETGLLTLLLCLAVLFALRYSEERNTPCMLLMALCLGLAYLTRPDSLIPSLLILGYCFWERRIEKGGRSRLFYRFAVAALVLGVFVMGQAIFRWSYYGQWVPNTYTLKLTGMPLMLRIQNGLGFIWPFFLTSAALYLIIGIGLSRRPQKEAFLLVLIAAALFGYQIWIGGDPWRYWRIPAPAMPLLLAVSIPAILDLAFALRRPGVLHGPGSRNTGRLAALPWGAWVALLAGIVLTSINAQFWSQALLIARPATADFNEEDVNIALSLREITTPDATVGVFWAGTIPYYLDRVAIDFLGKADPRIARMPADVSGTFHVAGMASVPGHNKYDLQYSIKKLLPTWVQTSNVPWFKWGRDDLSEWARSHYVMAEYQGTRFALLKHSTDVRWEKVRVLPAPPEPRGAIP